MHFFSSRKFVVKIIYSLFHNTPSIIFFDEIDALAVERGRYIFYNLNK
jgi:ATP-dependent 26S proteasome regulatory subunit